VLKKLLMTAILGTTLATTACSTTDDLMSAASLFGGDSLVTDVTSKLGLDAKQVAGGLGAALSYVQSRLPESNYKAITQFLPGADKYLDFAKTAGLLDSPITDKAQLSSTLNDLGVPPDTAQQMYRQVGDYIAGNGGETAKVAFLNLLR